MSDVLDEVMLDLVQHMGLEPEEILEFAPLAVAAAGMAATAATGWAASKLAGSAGKKAGSKAAENEINKRAAQARADRDARLRDLVQKRDKVRNDLAQAKSAAQRTTNTMSPGVTQ